MPQYHLHPNLEKAISALFSDPSIAQVLLGLGDPQCRHAKKPDLDRTKPIFQRVRLFRRFVEDWLIFKAAELEDLGEMERPRLQAEATALLVVLREMMRHFPDVFDLDN